MKILHVTTVYSGGTKMAIRAGAGLADNADHFLLYSVSKSDFNDGDSGFYAGANDELSANLVVSMYQIYREFIKIRPDYVHLHSSIAGFVGRMSGIPSSRVLYSPHGYAFQRKDISRLLRSVFFAAEYFLTKISRKSKIVVCGPGEYAAAKKITSRIFQLYNFSNLDTDKVWVQSERVEKIVCMSGRICRQKDPLFFIKIMELLKLRTDLRFVWLGDGDDLLKRKLEAVGVEVTGWVDKESIIEYIINADVFLYTSEWDGLPLSLLEASKLMIPLVVRETEATSFIPGLLCKTAVDAAVNVELMLETPKFELNHVVNKMFTKDKYFDSLSSLYKLN